MCVDFEVLLPSHTFQLTQKWRLTKSFLAQVCFALGGNRNRL